MNKSLLLLFVVAAFFRIILSVAQLLFGIQRIPALPEAELIADFHGVYGSQLGLLHAGLLPYRDFPYSYTPLFLYSLLPFYSIGGVNAAAIPIVLADAATAAVIYFIVREMASNKIAFLAGLAYALSPFMLLYEGYLWLGSQPMTLFLMASIYLLRRDKTILSSFALAIAVLMKQDALFVLPVYIGWQLWKYGVSASKSIVTLVLVILAGSLPFAISSPEDFLALVSYNLLAKYTPNTTSAGVIPTSLNPSLEAFTQLCSSASVVQGIGILACSIPGSGYSYQPMEAAESIIYWISSYVRIPLLLLIAPAVYVSRRRNYVIEVASAYSFTGFLILFSVLVHPLFRYYLVPVYALLLASARSRASLIVVTGVQLISILSPAGIFQEILPLAAVLAVLAVQDRHQSHLPS
ncbi:MAG: glycosyltransferase family 39 protein [Thaumarchaeota archaeon]|nr:glycosyltransferase family 39 protein [Nitrososphaerota archaeon]